MSEEHEYTHEVEQLKQEIERLRAALAFYQGRCHSLQRNQKHFREPERGWVCNTLANGDPTTFGDIEADRD